jgi:hypothetical protein
MGKESNNKLELSIAFKDGTSFSSEEEVKPGDIKKIKRHIMIAGGRNSGKMYSIKTGCFKLK